MNAQREVVYKRRRHALFGERLKLDSQTFFDTCELIVDQNKAAIISKL
jgi:preprotein translocase subunit SecA